MYTAVKYIDGIKQPVFDFDARVDNIRINNLTIFKDINRKTIEDSIYEVLENAASLEIEFIVPKPLIDSNYNVNNPLFLKIEFFNNPLLVCQS